MTVTKYLSQLGLPSGSGKTDFVAQWKTLSEADKAALRDMALREMTLLEIAAE